MCRDTSLRLFVPPLSVARHLLRFFCPPGVLFSFSFRCFWRPTRHPFYLDQQALLCGNLALLITTSLRPRQGLTDPCLLYLKPPAHSYLFALGTPFVFWRPARHHFFLGQQTLVGDDHCSPHHHKPETASRVTDLCLVSDTLYLVALGLRFVFHPAETRYNALTRTRHTSNNKALHVRLWQQLGTELC